MCDNNFKEPLRCFQFNHPNLKFGARRVSAPPFKKGTDVSYQLNHKQRNSLESFIYLDEMLVYFVKINGHYKQGIVIKSELIYSIDSGYVLATQLMDPKH